MRGLADEWRRRTQAVWDLKAEARRAAGGDYVRSADAREDKRPGEEARLEQPALIGVGTLEHRDMVELAGREGRMEAARQDFRSEVGRDAEAAEVLFIREDLRRSQSLEAGKGQGAAA